MGYATVGIPIIESTLVLGGTMGIPITESTHVLVDKMSFVHNTNNETRI